MCRDVVGAIPLVVDGGVDSGVRVLGADAVVEDAERLLVLAGRHGHAGAGCHVVPLLPRVDLVSDDPVVHGAVSAAVARAEERGDGLKLLHSRRLRGVERVIIRPREVSGQRMDQRGIRGQVIQNDQADLDALLVHLRYEEVILSADGLAEVIGLAVVGVADAAPVAEVPDRQVVRDLLDAEGVQLIAVQERRRGQQSLLAGVVALCRMRCRGLRIRDEFRVSDRGRHAVLQDDELELAEQVGV